MADRTAGAAGGVLTAVLGGSYLLWLMHKRGAMPSGEGA
jgi:iron complex transport system permease protein